MLRVVTFFHVLNGCKAGLRSILFVLLVSLPPLKFSKAATTKNVSALPTKLKQAVVTAHGKQIFNGVPHHEKKDAKVRRERKVQSELHTGTAELDRRAQSELHTGTTEELDLLSTNVLRRGATSTLLGSTISGFSKGGSQTMPGGLHSGGSFSSQLGSVSGSFIDYARYVDIPSDFKIDIPTGGMNIDVPNIDYSSIPSDVNIPTAGSQSSVSTAGGSAVSRAIAAAVAHAAAAATATTTGSDAVSCTWKEYHGACADADGKDVADGEESVGTFENEDGCKESCCAKDTCLAIFVKTDFECFEHTSGKVTKGTGPSNLASQRNNKCFIKQTTITTTKANVTQHDALGLQNAETAGEVGKLVAKVLPGNCENRKMTGEETAKVSCDGELSLTGCSCRAAGSEQCASEFPGGQVCNAFAKEKTEVTAIARCCNLPWVPAESWEIVTSDPPATKAATVSCPAGKIRTGCACFGNAFPWTGCDGVEAVPTAESCKGYNSPGHEAGVKVQARCATMRASDKFIVKSGDSKELSDAAPTDLICDDVNDVMISCQCLGGYTADSTKTRKACYGGSILIEQCQCWGEACVATATCGKLPVDCQWSEWAAWGECNSSSCHEGRRNRSRTQLSPALGGGAQCSPSETIKVGECDCNGTLHEESGGFGGMFMYIAIGGGALVVLGGGAAAFAHSQQGHGHGHGPGEGAFAEKPGGEWGQDYSYGGQGYGADYGGGYGGESAAW